MNLKTFLFSFLFSPLLVAQTLKGHWVLTDISCESGNVPQPGFQKEIRYDFYFFEQQFENVIVSPATWSIYRGSYQVDQTQLCIHATEFLQSEKPSEPHDFKRCLKQQQKESDLVLSFASEEGDDCPSGDLVHYRFKSFKN